MEEIKKLNTTLVLLMQDNKILLAEKKRGFAKGTFNGIGGKQDVGETIEQAMIRETQEEICVTPYSYKKVGIINFNVYYKGELTDLKMHIYTCDKYYGEIKETEEMKPEWFEKENIPFDKMLPGDKLWYSSILDGKFIKGKISMNQNFEITYSNINIVSQYELEI